MSAPDPADGSLPGVSEGSSSSKKRHHSERSSSKNKRNPHSKALGSSDDGHSLGLSHSHSEAKSTSSSPVKEKERNIKRHNEIPSETSEASPKKSSSRPHKVSKDSKEFDKAKERERDRGHDRATLSASTPDVHSTSVSRPRALVDAPSRSISTDDALNNKTLVSSSGAHVASPGTESRRRHASTQPGLTSYTMPAESVLHGLASDEGKDEKNSSGPSKSPSRLGRLGVRRMTKEEEEALKNRASERRDVGARANAFRDRLPDDVKLDPLGFVPVAPRSSSGLCCEGAPLKDTRIISAPKRLWVGYADTLGRRDAMEDAMLIFGAFMFNDKLDLIGVFDGHNGADVAQFAAAQMPRLLERQLKKDFNPPKALVAAYLEANKLIGEKAVKGGSTALVALLGDAAVHIANAGDCRAVLVDEGAPIRLTVDHRPEQPDERKRIEAAGGTVVGKKTRDGKEAFRINGILGVTRALGDLEFGSLLLCEPEVFEIEWSALAEATCLVLACDGLYELLSDEEVADIATKHLAMAPGDVEGAARRLRDVSYARGCGDNISVIVVMKGTGAPPSPPAAKTTLPKAANKEARGGYSLHQW